MKKVIFKSSVTGFILTFSHFKLELSRVVCFTGPLVKGNEEMDTRLFLYKLYSENKLSNS